MPTPYTSMMSSATKPGFEEKIHEDSGRNSDEISSTDTLLQPSLAPKRRSSYSPRNLFHYFALFLLGIFGFTALFVIIFRQQVAASIVELSARIAQCPTINATETVFAEHYEYQTWDDSSDVLWDHLLPPNGGFLADEKDPDALPNGVAMFHQLHCVGMFRNDFKELYARLAGRSDGGKNALYQIDEQHLLHCLDYLRQVFLCYADGELEPLMIDPHSGHAKTDGMVPHHCNNPQRLYDAALRDPRHFDPHGKHDKSSQHQLEQ